MHNDKYRAVHQIRRGWVIVNRDGFMVEQVGENRDFAEDKARAYSEAARSREHHSPEQG